MLETIPTNEKDVFDFTDAEKHRLAEAFGDDDEEFLMCLKLAQLTTKGAHRNKASQPANQHG